MKVVFSKLSRQKFRRGLTLVELVIVMAILAGLAGILVPMLAGSLTRAHTTSASTNIGEIAKSMQMYEATYLSYPNNFDSLISGTAYVTYLKGSGSADFVAPAPLAVGYSALTGAGITTILPMANSGTGDFSPTFYPYGDDASVSLTSSPALATVAINASTNLPQITGAAAAREFGAPIDAKYVILGIGRFNSMQGKTMLEAPVHFAETADGAPNLAYARYGAVFQVTDAAGTSALDRAKLIGIVGFHDDGIASLGEHLNEYWNANK